MLSQSIGTENCLTSYLNPNQTSFLFFCKSSPMKFQQELSLVRLLQPDSKKSIWKYTKIHRFQDFSESTSDAVTAESILRAWTFRLKLCQHRAKTFFF